MGTGLSLAALLLVLVSAAHAPAQTVSAEVMRVLMRGQLAIPGDTYDLTVGAAPKGFPLDLLPPGGRVLASTAAPSLQTVVVEARGLEDVVRTTYAAALSAAGWASPLPNARGFTTATQLSLAVCKDFDHVSVQFLPGPQDHTYVRIGLQHDTRRRCTTRQDTFFSDVPIPTLRHPDGVTASGASSGGSSDAYHTGTQLDRSLTAAQLADHYHRQIIAAGWVEAARLADPALVVVRYTATLKSGEVLTALLTVTTSRTHSDLFLRITRPRTRR